MICIASVDPDASANSWSPAAHPPTRAIVSPTHASSASGARHPSSSAASVESNRRSSKSTAASRPSSRARSSASAGSDREIDDELQPAWQMPNEVTEHADELGLIGDDVEVVEHEHRRISARPVERHDDLVGEDVGSNVVAQHRGDPVDNT